MKGLPRNMGKRKAKDDFVIGGRYKKKGVKSKPLPPCQDCGEPKKSHAGRFCAKCSPKHGNRSKMHPNRRPASTPVKENKGTRWVIQAFGSDGSYIGGNEKWDTWLGPFFSGQEYNTNPDLGVNVAYFRHARWTPKKIIEHFFDRATEYSLAKWSFRLLTQRPIEVEGGRYVYETVKTQMVSSRPMDCIQGTGPKC